MFYEKVIPTSKQFICCQSYKHFTLVNYDSRVAPENTPYYDPRVVIYERKMFIRLATGAQRFLQFGSKCPVVARGKPMN